MNILHADYCPEKGDMRCDCDYEQRVRADERKEMRRSVETLGGYIRKREDGDYVPLPIVLMLIDRTGHAG